MQLLLQRLVVIQIRVRWRAVHEQINHPLRLGRIMRQRTQPAIRPAGLARQAVLLQQAPQSRRANPRRRPAEKLPTIDHELGFSQWIHIIHA